MMSFKVYIFFSQISPLLRMQVVGSFFLSVFSFGFPFLEKLRHKGILFLSVRSLFQFTLS